MYSELNELVKALRICAKTHGKGCQKCSYLDDVECDDNIKLDAADAIEELIAKNERLQKEARNWYLAYMDLLPERWISVDEALPDSSENVLVVINDTAGDTAFCYTSVGWLTTDKEYWIVDNEQNNYVTHWRPLPPPPIGGD